MLKISFWDVNLIIFSFKQAVDRFLKFHVLYSHCVFVFSFVVGANALHREFSFSYKQFKATV